MERLGVAALARRGTQRRGQVVHLRIGEWRLIVVLAHEPVLDAAGVAAGERLGQRGAAGTPKCLTMRLRCPSLRGEHERGSELSGGCSPREHRGHPAAGADPAGGHERAVGYGAHELQERQEPVVAGSGVVKGGAMAARLDALDDQRVGAAVCREHGLGRGGDRHPHRTAGLLQPGDVGGVRTSGHERDHGHPLVAREHELLLPAVVVVPRVAELDVLALSLLGKGIGIASDRLAVVARPAGDEDVQPERARGERAQLRDVGAHRVRRPVAGREEAEPTRLAYGRGQRGRGRPAAHRRLDDGYLEI